MNRQRRPHPSPQSAYSSHSLQALQPKHILQLLESSTLDTQNQILGNLRRQEPSLAALLQAKLLTPERICSWEPSVLAFIIADFSDTQLTSLASDLLEKSRSNLFASMGVERAQRIAKRVIAQVEANTSDSVRIALVSRVRELERSEQLDLAAFAPTHQLCR